MNYEKAGYLKDSFKIFYLSDSSEKDFPYHYHDFHKIIIFLQGNVNYYIEGQTFRLTPYDILLIHSGQIHRPLINTHEPYERIIIYVSKDYLDNIQMHGYDLSFCFARTIQTGSNLLRIENLFHKKIYENIVELKNSFLNEEFAAPLYRDSLFLSFLILLNRSILQKDISYLKPTISNTKIMEIIEYINQNITEDLPINRLASVFFLNSSYLMHLFKNETGFSIGNYITKKRLYLAAHLITEGTSLTEACSRSGFKNYSSFFRAFKENIRCPPKKFRSYSGEILKCYNTQIPFFFYRLHTLSSSTCSRHRM